MATIASVPAHEGGAGYAQPAVGQRRQLGLAAEGELDEAVGEVGEGEDRQ